jgi:hypothetical protein
MYTPYLPVAAFDNATTRPGQGVDDMLNGPE